jgi:hypothetical protein
VTRDKSLRERRFTRARLGGNGDDPPLARAGVCERIAQAPQWFIALQ